jgi:hypothetical protein
MTLTKHDIIGLAKELRTQLENLRRQLPRMRFDASSAEYGFGAGYYAVMKVCEESPHWNKEVWTRFHNIIGGKDSMYYKGGEEE